MQNFFNSQLKKKFQYNSTFPLTENIALLFPFRSFQIHHNFSFKSLYFEFTSCMKNIKYISAYVCTQTSEIQSNFKLLHWTYVFISSECEGIWHLWAKFFGWTSIKMLLRNFFKLLLNLLLKNSWST